MADNTTSGNTSEISLEDTFDFFEGKVKLIDFNLDFTRFQILANKTIIDVPNSLHIRLSENHETGVMNILTYVGSIRVVQGELPKEQVLQYPLSYYKELNKKYVKNVPESAAEFFTVENYYVQNELFSKETLDELFGFSKTMWVQYAADMKAGLPAGANLETRLDEGDQVIIVTHGKVMYSISYISNKKTGKIEAIQFTQAFADNSFSDDQKKFFSEKLDKNEYVMPGTNYSIFSVFENLYGIDSLTFFVRHL